MKYIPCAYLLGAAALLGLPLVSLSAPPDSGAAVADDPVTPAVLRKYDTNKDGVLDESEKAAWKADKERQQAAREARRTADLARYDADKDGRLSPEERAARRADIEKARAEKKSVQEARKTERAAAAEAKQLARYDRNGDGKLDEAELAAAKNDEERRKAAAEKRKAARPEAGTGKEAPAAGNPEPNPVDDDSPPVGQHD